MHRGKIRHLFLFRPAFSYRHSTTSVGQSSISTLWTSSAFRIAYGQRRYDTAVPARRTRVNDAVPCHHHALHLESPSSRRLLRGFLCARSTHAAYDNNNANLRRENKHYNIIWYTIVPIMRRKRRVSTPMRIRTRKTLLLLLLIRRFT